MLILSYDFLNEFSGERDATAEQYKCNKEDIKISYKKPQIKDNKVKNNVKARNER